MSPLRSDIVCVVAVPFEKVNKNCVLNKLFIKYEFIKGIMCIDRCVESNFADKLLCPQVAKHFSAIHIYSPTLMEDLVRFTDALIFIITHLRAF